MILPDVFLAWYCFHLHQATKLKGGEGSTPVASTTPVATTHPPLHKLFPLPLAFLKPMAQHWCLGAEYQPCVAAGGQQWQWQLGL